MKELPTPCVIVVDPDRRVARTLADFLSSKVKDVKVIEFWDPDVAWRKIGRDKRLEPALVITDKVGVHPYNGSLIKRVREMYPKSYVVLYSESASEKEIFTLQNDKGAIHRFVSKTRNLPVLSDIVIEYVRRYEEDPILKSLRLYIKTCRSPDVPFFQTNERSFNLFDVYLEILQNTRIGNTLKDAWTSLLVRAVVASTDKEA